jgi:hypothetical protein
MTSCLFVLPKALLLVLGLHLPSPAAHPLQIERLSEAVDPARSALPDAVRQYAPPSVQKQTSYDGLKAAGHRAAGHIETWRRCGCMLGEPSHQGSHSNAGRSLLLSFPPATARMAGDCRRRCCCRHGSVYRTQGHESATAAADPYQAMSEALGKGRRQELFSFAAAQLLAMGTPERSALLLRWVWAGVYAGWVNRPKIPGDALCAATPMQVWQTYSHTALMPGFLLPPALQPGHGSAAQLPSGSAVPVPAGASG